MPGWSQTEIHSTSADVFEPAAAPRCAVLFLHPRGDETLAHAAANPAFTDALEECGLACCCPHASKSWWTERLCPWFDPEQSPEAFLLDHVLPWMQARWKLPDRSIAAAGISMGGQGALRLAFRHAARFPVAASIAGAIDFHEKYDDPQFAELREIFRSREQARQHTATLQVRADAVPRHIWFACDPTDELCFSGNDRLREKLRAFGVPHTAELSTSNGGHAWSYFNAMAQPMMRFLADALTRESRRLLD